VYRLTVLLDGVRYLTYHNQIARASTMQKVEMKRSQTGGSRQEGHDDNGQFSGSLFLLSTLDCYEVRELTPKQFASILSRGGIKVSLELG
jgi:hypothetical protein